MRLVASAAAALVAPGKGILDADEDAATIAARLTAAGIPATRENRRACREMLITTPGLAEGISGVTLCDETLRQDATLGRTFPALYALGMMAGIRVDAGPGPLAGTRGETVTEGLDGLLPGCASMPSSGPSSPVAGGAAHRARHALGGRGAGERAGAGPVRGRLP